ncbi:SRPBCC family protein [Kitasatospora sp. McL0602]|uniref:SRPBCC family protein n=1 Tax=Kitasatospora sp. McL0602 TaxID=3439530 RepID=UPI003F8CCFF2
MSEIAFDFDTTATRATLLQALNTHDGLISWWTTGVDRKDEVLLFDFPGVPEPFQLRRDEATEDRVVWTSVGAFPPHWSGTTITWTLSAGAGGAPAHVAFRHTGWQDDDPGLPQATETWGQLMDRLKSYAETGTAQPLFTL